MGGEATGQVAGRWTGRAHGAEVAHFPFNTRAAEALKGANRGPRFALCGDPLVAAGADSGLSCLHRVGQGDKFTAGGGCPEARVVTRVVASENWMHSGT